MPGQQKYYGFVRFAIRRCDSRSNAKPAVLDSEDFVAARAWLHANVDHVVPAFAADGDISVHIQIGSGRNSPSMMESAPKSINANTGEMSMPPSGGT